MDSAPGHSQPFRRLPARLLGTGAVVLALFAGGVYWVSLGHLRSARAARRDDRYSKAERHLAACWQLPGLWTARELEDQLISLQQGNLANEEAWVTRTRPSNKDAILILEALAKANLAIFQWNDAREYADAILERAPRHARALWLRGQAWVKLQQEPKALDDFQQALENEPEASEIHLSLADLLLKLGHVREADAHYRQLLTALPGDERVVLSLARCRYEEGRSEDARQLLKALLQSRPDCVPALVEKARLALRAENMGAALYLLYDAFYWRRGDSQIGHLLQLCCGMPQREHDGLDEVFATNERQQVAIRLKIQETPRDPGLLVEQGRWVMRSSEWREAVGWFYLALKEDANHITAHAALADYFRLADQPLRSLRHAQIARYENFFPIESPEPLARFPPVTLADLPPVLEATEADVRRLCAACHAYPPPESFPRSAWRKEVRQGFELLHDSPLGGQFPPLESIVAYYERRAPERLPELQNPPAAKASPFKFEPLRTGWLENVPPYPGIANLHLVNLLGDEKLELLASDTRLNRVLLMQPYGSANDSQILPELHAPCHMAVVDLDRDGQQDILVACLGQFYPTDAKVGSVAWLRRTTAGNFTAQTLLKNVGRVSDVQAGDFNADGKLDLIVAAFGWRQTGEILYLENQTTDWNEPAFVQHVVEPRHGAIHVPPIDLNRDGRLDFVALLSQEHESVVAYLNEGAGAFLPNTIYVAPHPAYGSSGIEVVDLDSDGDHDVLLTNGDVLDRPYLLKPYHGIQWLENEGTFPFKHRALAPMYGASRAVAADFDGDQDLDIIAVSFLPKLEFPERDKLKLPSILLLEQTSPREFTPHTLETGVNDHFTCTAGDWDADGDPDFAVGNFSWKRSQAINDAAVLWFNRLNRSEVDPQR